MWLISHYPGGFFHTLRVAAEVVIKYGGAAMVESPERTMRDVAALAAMGLKPVTGTQKREVEGQVTKNGNDISKCVYIYIDAQMWGF